VVTHTGLETGYAKLVCGQAGPAQKPAGATEPWEILSEVTLFRIEGRFFSLA